MNILVLTPYIPYPPNFGGSVRIFNLIRQLHRLGHAVHLLSFREQVGAGDPQGLAPFCQTIKLIPRDTGHKRRRQFLSLLSSRSFQWLYHYSKAMQSALDSLVHDQKINLILVEFSQMAGYRFPAGVPVVLDEHNVEFDLLDSMATREHGALRKFFNRIEAEKFRREELSACRAAALTLVTSDRDGELLRQHAPQLNTATITNGVDCDQFARPAGPRRPGTAVFVGATHYFPNEEGVLFFLREILPLIKQKQPHFRFAVVGGKPPPSIMQYQSESVEVTGYVNDVRPYMWETSVFVVPLRMGGGTRFKIVEALAAGIPVVSTRLGAEGIPVTHARELLLADEPAAFADAVVQLLTDAPLAQRLSAAGLDFVKARFDWRVIGDRIEEAWHELER